MTLRIGTRGSALALWQANAVAAKLRAAGVESQLVDVTTTADQRQDVALSQIGGKGLFIKELEEQLLAGTIDVAVHSLKDVPAQLDGRFTLAAFLERGDARDAWLSSSGARLETLAADARVGTSAPRRRAQLLANHPHLRIEPIRGNVDSRIAKMTRGEYDALVLAAAGLVRLGLAARAVCFFDVEEMVPAAGQGIVAIETLAVSHEVLKALSAVSDMRASLEASCEREVLQHLGSHIGCDSPVAVHATVSNGQATVRAFVSRPDGAGALRVTRSGSTGTVAGHVGRELITAGALEMLA